MSDQVLIKDVVNFTMADYVTKAPFFFGDYAMVTSNDNKATRVEIRGGIGNYLLGVMDHSKTSTLNVTLPVVDLKMIAYLNGDTVAPAISDVMQRDNLTVENINTGTVSVTAGATTAGNVVVTLNGTAYNVAVLATDTANQVAGKIQTALSAVSGVTATVSASTVTLVSASVSAMTLSVTVGTTGVTATSNVTSQNGVLLTQTPLAGTSVSLFNLSGERDYGTTITSGTPNTTPNTYSITGQQIALNSTSNPIGSQVIAVYQFATSANAKKVSINASKFPKTVWIYGDGAWYDQVDEVNRPVKVQYYKAKAKSDITFTMEGTKATELQIVFDLMPVVNANGDMAFGEQVVLY